MDFSQFVLDRQCTFVEREKFIQGLHTGHSHWVTITTDNAVVDPLDPVVYVYDSTKQPSKCTACMLAYDSSI